MIKFWKWGAGLCSAFFRFRREIIHKAFIYGYLKYVDNHDLSNLNHATGLCTNNSVPFFKGFASCSATNPIWLVKTRLQLDLNKNGKRLTAGQCIRRIYRTGVSYHNPYAISKRKTRFSTNRVRCVRRVSRVFIKVLRPLTLGYPKLSCTSSSTKQSKRD